MAKQEESAHDSRRAQRFHLNVPMQVKSGEERIETITRDASYKGVYFYSKNADPEQDLREDAPVEFTMQLNPNASLGEGIQVHCKGMVVRVERQEDGTLGVAARIDSYQFANKRKADC